MLRRWARDLQQTGRRVLAAASGREALGLAGQMRPDIAIVDLFLAAENGVDVIRQLKGQDESLYAILVSAHLSVAYTMAAVRAGADDVCFKPVSFKQVIDSIERGEPFEPAEGDTPTLDELEWEHISRVLLDCDGNITHAAERLGIYRQTLQRKLRRYMPRS